MFNLEQIVYTDTERKAVFQNSEGLKLEVDFNPIINVLLSAQVISGKIAKIKEENYEALIGDLYNIPVVSDHVTVAIPDIYSTILNLVCSELKFPRITGKIGEEEIKITIGSSIKLSNKDEIQMEEFVMVIGTFYSLLLVRANIGYYGLEFEKLEIQYNTNSLWGTGEKIIQELYSIMNNKMGNVHNVILTGEFAQIKLYLSTKNEKFEFIFDDSCVNLRSLLLMLDHMLAIESEDVASYKWDYPVSIQIKHQNIPLSYYNIVIKEGGQCNLLHKEVDCGQAFKLLHSAHMAISTIISGAICLIVPKLMRELYE